MGRLDGKVAIVTGAARGQGAAICERFVAEGARVLVTDVLEEQAQALAGRLGENAAWCRLDVSKAAEWDTAVGVALSRFGKLDILINNAGVFPMAPMLEMPEEQFMQVIRVNQLGVWLGMRAVAEPMRRAGGGVIVNTASVAGVTGLANLSAYVGSKHAVRGLSKTAALELAPLGIRVNTVLPGAILGASAGPQIDPAVLRQAFRNIPLQRPGSTDEIARLMVFLASDESAYMSGSEILIDGGWQAGSTSPGAMTN